MEAVREGIAGLPEKAQRLGEEDDRVGPEARAFLVELFGEHQMNKQKVKRKKTKKEDPRHCVSCEKRMDSPACEERGHPAAYPEHEDLGPGGGS